MKADNKTSPMLARDCEAQTALHARQSVFDAVGRESSSSTKEPGVLNPLQPAPRSAEDSATALFEIIDELFDAYQADADDWRAQSIEFSLSALLDAVVNMFSERAETKELQLRLDVSATMPLVVRGDRDCLHQILTDLVANAVKCTERGTVTVRCSVAEETTRRALIRFSIENTGIGSDRMDLSACRRLVRHLGGWMKEESELGRASTVSFSIVLNKRDCLDRSAAAQAPTTERWGEGGSHDTIHVQSLLDRCFGDANFCTLMLRKFSHRAGDQLAALDRAARSGNAIELAREAHTLKGLAGNLSAAPLQISADRLEQVARRSELEEAGSLVDQVRDQVTRCMEEIPRILAQIARSE